MNTLTFRDSQQAFKEAIDAGRLSAEPAANNYAGRFMYMGDCRTPQGNMQSQFKRIDTREYLP